MKRSIYQNAKPVIAEQLSKGKSIRFISNLVKLPYDWVWKFAHKELGFTKDIRQNYRSLVCQCLQNLGFSRKDITKYLGVYGIDTLLKPRSDFKPVEIQVVLAEGKFNFSSGKYTMTIVSPTAIKINGKDFTAEALRGFISLC